MGFHYAREKQKFDAEWERLSAWYQAEGMSAEAIEAIRQFDWANFCHQRVYEHWTTAFPEDILNHMHGNKIFREAFHFTRQPEARYFLFPFTIIQAEMKMSI